MPDYNDERRHEESVKARNREKDNQAYKKKMEYDQANEYTKVNHYKEAFCWSCAKNGDICTATLVDCCKECIKKRGNEGLMAVVTNKGYGYCFFCNSYTWTLWQINVRLCRSCNGRVVDYLRNYNKAGGMFTQDPFWKWVKQKNNQDYDILKQNGARVFG